MAKITNGGIIMDISDSQLQKYKQNGWKEIMPKESPKEPVKAAGKDKGK